MNPTSVLVTSLIALVMISACAAQPDAQTEGATGEAAVTSSDSPLAADYDRKTAAEKQDILWTSHIAPSKYATLPPWPSVDLIGIVRLDLGVTLNRTNDELPMGRKKLVHALGSCAKVELVADGGTPYTGMFKGGIGIARFSLATNPGTDAFTPAIAVKMLVDGMPSQNLQVMFSVDGQGKDFDFFSNRFSNIIAAPVGFGTNIVGKIFQKATPFPNYLDLDNFARHDRTGADASHMRAPHQVFFLPTSEVRAARVVAERRLPRRPRQRAERHDGLRDRGQRVEQRCVRAHREARDAIRDRCGALRRREAIFQARRSDEGALRTASAVPTPATARAPARGSFSSGPSPRAPSPPRTTHAHR
jgi:hypothetical protein